MSSRNRAAVLSDRSTQDGLTSALPDVADEGRFTPYVDGSVVLNLSSDVGLNGDLLLQVGRISSNDGATPARSRSEREDERMICRYGTLHLAFSATSISGATH